MENNIYNNCDKNNNNGEPNMENNNIKINPAISSTTKIFETKTRSKSKTIKSFTRPLYMLLTLSILSATSLPCLANNKQYSSNQIERHFTKDDIRGEGWWVALKYARQLGLKDDFYFTYTKQDIELIRELNHFFSPDKIKETKEILTTVSSGKVLNQEETLTYQKYSDTLAAVKEMLLAKAQNLPFGNESTKKPTALSSANPTTPSSNNPSDLLPSNLWKGEMTDEEFKEFRENFFIYNSLHPYTRTLIFNKWNGLGTPTPQEEKDIEEIDAFYSNPKNLELIRNKKKYAKLSKSQKEEFDNEQNIILQKVFSSRKSINDYLKEDTEGKGWEIALKLGKELNLDDKFILELTPHDRSLIRKVSSFYNTKEKNRQMHLLLSKEKNKKELTQEEAETLAAYNNAMRKLKAGLEFKK